MFCPQCGAPNEEDAIFCGNCGAVLNADEVPAEEVTEEAEVVEEVAVEEPKELFLEETAQDLSLEEMPPEPLPPAPPPQPRPAPAVGQVPATSGLAIAALVLGIGGLTILPLLGSILAIILGYMARNDIRKRPHEITGDGLALAGIVMGWIAVGLAIVGLVIGGGFMVCGICASLGAGY